MTFGSGPITGRLAAYSAGQPPRTANRAAMLDSVSPSCTTYLVLGLGAAAAAGAALSVLVKMTSVLLPAVRVFACAGRTDALRPTATPMIRTLQASTTHADLVRIRTVLSLSFRGGISAGTLLARTPKARTSGKERTYAGGTSGR